MIEAGDPSARSSEEQAARLALDYMAGQGDGWGTYYGPVSAAPDGQGGRLEYPSLADVTPEVLACWQQTAKDAKVDPHTRALCADLVWDLGKATGQKVDVEFARIAIDDTLGTIGAEDSRDAFDRLERALAVARSLRDAPRAARVRDALIATEDRIAEDGKPGLWGHAFRFILGDSKVPVSAEQETKLVRDMEERLARLTQPASEGQMPDGHSAKHAALLLAGYYRKRGCGRDARRVLVTYGRAMLAMAEHAKGMLGFAWSQEVYEVYRDHGLTADAQEILVRLQELAPEVVRDLKPISVSGTISAEDIEPLFAEVTGGNLEKGLAALAVTFIPNAARLVERVQRQAREFPLSGLFRAEILDYRGRPAGRIGSTEEDLEGRIVQEIGHDLQGLASLLREAVDRLCRHFKPSPDDLLNVLRASPLFEADRAPLIKHGLESYLRGDAVAAIHVLIPQIEDAVRNFVRLSGRPVYKSGRNGTLQLRTLGDLLREEVVGHIFGDDTSTYLRALLADERGLNLRNGVCHGILPGSMFNPAVADRTFHALLILGLARPAKPEEADG